MTRFRKFLDAESGIFLLNLSTNMHGAFTKGPMGIVPDFSLGYIMKRHENVQYVRGSWLRALNSYLFKF